MVAHENELDAQLGWELGQAIQRIMAASFDRNFEDVIGDYRRIEEDFMNRASGNDFHVLETKRRIAEAILLATHSHRQPFDICRNAWDDLVRLGFTNLRTRCTESWWYADCCLLEGQFDIGLAVLEPLIVDMERQVDEAIHSNRSPKGLKEQLVRLEQLRDKLKAGLRK